MSGSLDKLVIGKIDATQFASPATVSVTEGEIYEEGINFEWFVQTTATELKFGYVDEFDVSEGISGPRKREGGEHQRSSHQLAFSS